MIVKFLPEADNELQEALIWYSQKKLGLDMEFMRCIDEAISRIVSNPNISPKALKNVRKALVKRFPFIIYYEYRDNEIMVLAVFHAKRDPIQWQKRT